ncbi:Clavaminate synthase-like protein [Daldinia sp. FL1419]|nr:Clavaminate synthase-like protein [Daldinia sp. FL1419]
MSETKYTKRPIPRISLRDFPSRIDDITAALLAAAESSGFFTLVDHGIPPSAIEAQFALAESFFSLPDPTKSQTPFSPSSNTGWERASQVRPSTGVPDQKESFQMQFGMAATSWPPGDAIPGFRAGSLEFMRRAQEVSEKLMVCFARGLGFPDKYFVQAHDVKRPGAQTVLRLLKYFALDPAAPTPEGYYRAGAHADWDFVTLLFQRPGQGGLEICPGREAFTEFGLGDTWTPVEPVDGEIVCNIGDLLMSWSDDRFKSTFHRVKTPTNPAVDYYGTRYSMAYFNQPNIDCEIQGPLKKYPMVTGSEFTKAAMKRNYETLQKTKAAIADKARPDGGDLVAVIA